ncbi:MAG: hypothetical protein J6Q58_03755, partial [Clostridia bacterium]|nr:hypothetical protein [Clostridia bacterium]
MKNFCKHDKNRVCVNNGDCGRCMYHAKAKRASLKGESVVKPQTSISANDYLPSTNNNETHIDFKALYKIVMRLGVITKVKRFFNTGKNDAVLIIKRDGIGDFILFKDA